MNSSKRANILFVVIVVVYWLLVSKKVNWYPLAWGVLISIVLNSFDGLFPLSIDPVTSTHILLPLFVLFGAIIGNRTMIIVATIIVFGIYFLTIFFYWPLQNTDILKLTNLMLLTLVSTGVAYFIWSYQRKMLRILRQKTMDIEKELDINLQLNAIIFHDIRNPLFAITGLVDLTRFKKQVELTNIEQIGRNAYRISSIINSVSELTTNTSKTITISSIRISEIVHELHDLFASRFKQKEQDLIFTEGTDLEVKTHKEVLCNSVMSNLVSNAIKFSPRGASIEISASKEGEFVRLEVRDQGKGFPKELLKKIIEGENYKSIPGTEKEEGHGYGLRIAAMYLQRLQGSLQIRNREEEGGATIAILLPSRDLK